MTVNDRIRAVHVLQRFVMMSRTLLPNFIELTAKEKLTKSEEINVIQIKDVYDTFKANPEMSIILVNSKIFQLIRDVYRFCSQGNGHTPESFYAYNAFLEESDRLIDTWNKQALN